MKFHEVKRLRAAAENKMLRGTREDQGGRMPPLVEAPVVRPEVRELADELGVDLATVTGSGKNGNITQTDVRKAAAQRDQGEE